MRWFRKNEADTTAIDKQIQAVLSEMEIVGVSDEKYPKMIGYLKQLHELKARERREPVSSDMIAQIVGNLGGILLIIIYEQKHVLNSKGWSQLFRPRAT